MLKSMMLAAFAAVSVCAMAQDSWNGQGRTNIDANGKSHYEIKGEVVKQDQFLSGGDAYDFEAMLHRMQYNTEDALVSGLFAAHRQAVLIRDQMIASAFPSDSDVAAATTTNDQAVLAEETDTSMRPMRMVMMPDRSRDIDYNAAFDILTTDLNSTQRTELARWWDTQATDHQRDIVVRLLKIDAKKADEPIYASLYTHRMYDWVNK